MPKLSEAIPPARITQQRPVLNDFSDCQPFQKVLCARHSSLPCDTKNLVENCQGSQWPCFKLRPYESERVPVRLRKARCGGGFPHCDENPHTTDISAPKGADRTPDLRSAGARPLDFLSPERGWLRTSFDAKHDIVQNAIDLFTQVGLGTPRVAILSAVETVTAKIPSTKWPI